MKPILFVVLFGLSALAYASEPVTDEPGGEAAAVGEAPASATPASATPASIENNDFLTAPGNTSSCLATCAASYRFCLSASEDAVSDCACFEATLGCQSACGADSAAPVQC